MSQHEFDELMNDYYRDEGSEHAPDRLARRVQSVPDTEPDFTITPQSWRQRMGRWLGRDDGAMRSVDVRGRSRPTKDGRNRLMITAAGTAIAIAALALSVAFVDDTATTPVTAPGAEAPVVVPDDWAFFTGEMVYDGNWPTREEQPTRYKTEDGLVVSYDPFGYEGQTFTTTDPRLTGKRSELESAWFENGVDGAQIWTELSRIENEDGAWTCTLAQTDAADGSTASPQSGWCEGSEAYEGYRAFMALDPVGEVGAFSKFTVTGFVSNADGPMISADD